MDFKGYFLVDSKVLPPVFASVVYAKELLATGEARNASQAAKMAGISRSAFYKYKDFVFKYSDSTAGTVNLIAGLSDKAGVFSALTAVLYQYGGNILTVNQGIPIDGKADVSLTVKTDNLTVTLSELLKKLSEVDGVISIKDINGGKND